MYFESREQAGSILASRLQERYFYEDCVVVALNDGAVLIGEKIAKALNDCILTMLLVEDIEVPGESISFGGVSQNGDFTYNSAFSPGEVEDYTSEYHGYLEEQKRQAFQKINRILGGNGLIDNDMLRNKVVILVSDCFDAGSSLDIAVDFLKPVKTKKIVMASPISTVEAVDKLHIMADDLCILDVKPNFLGVNHYYDQNDIPSHEILISRLRKNIKKRH